MRKLHQDRREPTPEEYRRMSALSKHVRKCKICSLRTYTSYECVNKYCPASGEQP